MAERCPIPDAEGFYWAKWRIAASGTDACRKCGHESSSWERDGPEGKWEVVEVVENSSDPDDDEHFMVQVPGVSRWQSIEDFFWGPGPLAVPA
jgi:hypothetical protein